MEGRGSAALERSAARVVRFGDASAVAVVHETLRPPRGNEVVVRVTHATIGSTEVLARRGGYVFQPVPGFVPGYDFVGVLESGAPWIIDLRRLPHWLIVGATRSGKSTLIHALVAGLAPQPVALVGIESTEAG